MTPQPVGDRWKARIDSKKQRLVLYDGSETFNVGLDDETALEMLFWMDERDNPSEYPEGFTNEDRQP